MRVLEPLLLLILGGCASTEYAVGRLRPPVLRDLEGYAVASCLVSQSDPALSEQGDGWAAVIVQRMRGDLDPFSDVTEQVKAEVAKNNMVVIRSESGPGD